MYVCRPGLQCPGKSAMLQLCTLLKQSSIQSASKSTYRCVCVLVLGGISFLLLVHGVTNSQRYSVFHGI